MKSGIFFIVFVLIITISNAITFYDSWNWESFLKGFICTFPLLTIWLKNKKIAAFLGFLGGATLVLTALGVFNEVEREQLFFNGATIGFMCGIVPAVFLNRPTSYLYVSLALADFGFLRLSNKFKTKYETAINCKK